MSEPYTSPVYRTIVSRLAAFSPSIYLGKHSDLKAGRTTLQGITFVSADAASLTKLQNAFRNAVDGQGNQAFAEGSNQDAQHRMDQGDIDNWPLRKSFQETRGIGFREIWRPHLIERALSVDDARPDSNRPNWRRRFSGAFNDPVENQSSIHCAIAPEVCNIHIDEMGFVMRGPRGEILVNPDFAQHTVNELLLKTKLDGTLPDWMVDRFSIQVPNSTNAYSRFGISYDAIQRKSFRMRMTGSCSVLPPVDCSIGLSISGTHNLLDR